MESLMIPGKKELPTPIPMEKGALITNTLGIMGLHHPA